MNTEALARIKEQTEARRMELIQQLRVVSTGLEIEDISPEQMEGLIEGIVNCCQLGGVVLAQCAVIREATRLLLSQGGES